MTTYALIPNLIHCVEALREIPHDAINDKAADDKIRQCCNLTEQFIKESAGQKDAVSHKTLCEQLRGILNELFKVYSENDLPFLARGETIFVSNICYSMLLQLAWEYPINEISPVDLEPTEKLNAIPFLSGFVYTISDLLEFMITRDFDLETDKQEVLTLRVQLQARDPLTNLALHPFDQIRLREVAKEQKPELFAKLLERECEHTSTGVFFLKSNNNDDCFNYLFCTPGGDGLSY